MLVAHWTPLAIPSAAEPTRSSHSVAVHNSTAWFFGGELIPRIPLAAHLIAHDLKSGTTRSIAAGSGKSWPQARVGTSLVAIRDSLYLWGGRGGKEMGTFTDAITVEDEGEDLWKFDIATETWEKLLTSGGDDKPVQRSFHTMAAIGSTIFLHAGCPAKGRLGQLHSIDLDALPLTWRALSDAPGPGRGGTVLCPITTNGSPTLARFGGFAGLELGGLDVYDLKSESWEVKGDIAVEGAGALPEKRSVSALIPLAGDLAVGGKKAIAVLVHGEREGAPAELGHDGAGFFHSDVFALLVDTSSPPNYSWLPLPNSASSSIVPEARGWFASSYWEGNKSVVHGGLNERNERLGDGFILEVREE